MSAGTNRRLSRDSEHHRRAPPFDVGPLHGLLPSFSELIANAALINHHHHHNLNHNLNLNHNHNHSQNRLSARQPPTRRRLQVEPVPDSDTLPPDSTHLHPFLLGPAGGSRLRVIVHTPAITSAASATPNSPANMAPIHSPPSSVIRGHDRAEDARRVKRRKLESDKLGPNGFRGFRYGKFGQMEPGVLKMEMSSCDPGTYHLGSPHVPENMLNNFASVYCARGSRCNVVLKHQGETVFNLKELIIKTPRGLDFASPVRDGIVFVAMGLNELLTRTAQYRIQYVPATANTQLPPDESDGVADPRTERLESSSHTPRPPPPSQHVPTTWRARARQRRLNFMFDDADDSDESETKVASMPAEFMKTSSAVRTTSQCDYDHALDDVEPYLQSTPPIGRPSQTPRIGSLPFETDDDDNNNDDNNNDDNNNSNQNPGEFGPVDYLAQRLRGGPRPPMTFADSFETTTTLPASASADELPRTDNSPTQLMQPLARFHVERNTNKCTIRFDPPVAGRYILLKMWNAQDCGRIIIQSVTVKGYAGARYIPSIQWR